MRKVVTAVTAVLAVLTIAPVAVAQTPTPTVEVTQFDCDSVTVTGSGWEQTEATVEVAVAPPRGGDGFVAGPVQVFPDAEGNIAPTVLSFASAPPDGSYTAVVLVDGIVRGQSPAFTLTGCAPTAPTVTVTEFDCDSVTVTGSGWEQTEATVEVAVSPSEGGEGFVAGPVQVFPDAEGNIAPTVVPFDGAPPDGDYTAAVLVDGIVRGQSAGFTVTGCVPTPTVTVTEFDCDSVTVTGSGWEQTEATVEVAVPPAEGGESREDLIAGPVQVFPDTQGNIAPTVVSFSSAPPDGSYAAVVLVDGIVRGQSPGFTLTGCTPTPPTPSTTRPVGVTLPATGSTTTPLLAVGVVLVTLGFALVRRSRTS